MELDKDDPIDRNTIKMLMNTDPLIFPLDEEGLPEPTIHKIDESFSIFRIALEKIKKALVALI